MSARDEWKDAGDRADGARVHVDSAAHSVVWAARDFLAGRVPMADISAALDRFDVADAAFRAAHAECMDAGRRVVSALAVAT